jgi:hypothetical protein
MGRSQEQMKADRDSPATRAGHDRARRAGHFPVAATGAELLVERRAAG